MHYRYKLTNKAIAMLLSIFMLFSIAAQAAEIPAQPVIEVYEEQGEPYESYGCDTPDYDYDDYGDYGAGEDDGEYGYDENGDDEYGDDDYGDGIHDDDECDEEEPCDDELDEEEPDDDKLDYNENDYDEDEYYDEMYEDDDYGINDPCCDDAPDCDCEPYLDYEPEEYGCDCEDCDGEDCDCEDCDCGDAENEYFLLTFSHEGDGEFIVGGIESDGSEEYNEPLKVAAGTIIHLQAIPELDTDPEWWSDTALFPVGNPQPFGDPNQRMLIMPAADATVTVSFLSGDDPELTFRMVFLPGASPEGPPSILYDGSANNWYTLWGEFENNGYIVRSIPRDTNVLFDAFDDGLAVEWIAFQTDNPGEPVSLYKEGGHKHRLVMPDNNVTVVVTFRPDEFTIHHGVAPTSANMGSLAIYPSKVGNTYGSTEDITFTATPAQTPQATPNAGFRVSHLTQAVHTGFDDDEPIFGTPTYVQPNPPIRNPITGVVEWSSSSRPRNDMQFLVHFEPVTIKLESGRLNISSRTGSGSSDSVNATSGYQEAATGNITFSTSLTGTFTEELYFGGNTINGEALRATASEGGTITVTAIPANIDSGVFYDELTIYVRRERVTTSLIVEVTFPPITFELESDYIEITGRRASVDRPHSVDINTESSNATGPITFGEDPTLPLPLGLSISSNYPTIPTTVTVTQTAELTFLDNRIYQVVAIREGAPANLEIRVNLCRPEITLNPGEGTLDPEYATLTVDEYGFLDYDNLPRPSWEAHLFIRWEFENGDPIERDTQFLDDTILYARWGIPEISIDPSAPQNFGETYFGYSVGPGADEISPITVTVRNENSDVPTGLITVALRNDVGDSFRLSDTSLVSIPPGDGVRTFTVYPQEGLSWGVYTAIVDVSITGIMTLSFTVSFKVHPAQPNVIWPEEFSAVYGNTLLDITLPPHPGGQTMNPPVPSNVTTTHGRFEWDMLETTPVGDVGTRSFYLKFIPDDSYDGNFDTGVMPVTVTVNPRPIVGPGVYGVVPPNAGDNPVTATTGLSVEHDGLYEVSSVRWTHPPNVTDWAEPFVAGEKYMVTATLTMISTNHTFTGFTSPARINNQPIIIDPSISSDGRTLTISYLFPPTRNFSIAFDRNPLIFTADGSAQIPFGLRPAEETVTITNNGNEDTGNLTVTTCDDFDSLFTITNYDGTEFDFDASISIAVGGNLQIRIRPIEGIPATTNPQTATISIAPAPGNDDNLMQPQTFTVSIHVVPARPNVNWPEVLPAVFGNTLLDITLPNHPGGELMNPPAPPSVTTTRGHFEWFLSLDTSVGDAGDHGFMLEFIPYDGDNFTTAEQSVTVRVTPAPIENVHVKVTAPVAGMSPTPTAETVYPDTGIEDNPAVAWSPPPELAGEPRFDTEEIYTATVTILADPNHYFHPEIIATINDDYSPDNLEIQNNNTLILTFEFEKTGAHNLYFDPPDFEFDTAYFGDIPQEETVTIRNMLSGDTGPLVLEINNSDFEITTDINMNNFSLPGDGEVTFTLSPRANLDVGTHTAEITIRRADGNTNPVIPPEAPFIASFKVIPADITDAYVELAGGPFTFNGSRHEPTVVSIKTQRGLEITPPPALGNLFVIDYGYNINANVPGSVTITARAAPTNFTGYVTVDFEILKANQDAPDPPERENYDAITITLAYIPGAQFAISTTNTAPADDYDGWTTYRTFGGPASPLSPGTAYYFFARLQGDINHNPSPSSSARLETDLAELRGTPTISVLGSGSLMYRETLTVQTDSLYANPPGDTQEGRNFLDGRFTYQWQRSIAVGGWEDIPGATGATYDLDGDDIGREVKVVVSTDITGNPVESTPTAEIARRPPVRADLRYTLPDSIVFDGTTPLSVDVLPSDEVLDAGGDTAMGVITVEYRRMNDAGAVWSSTAPTNAGDYEVRANIDYGVRYTSAIIELDGHITIEKAIPTVDQLTGELYLPHTGDTLPNITNNTILWASQPEFAVEARISRKVGVVGLGTPIEVYYRHNEGVFTQDPPSTPGSVRVYASIPPGDNFLGTDGHLYVGTFVIEGTPILREDLNIEDFDGVFDGRGHGIKVEDNGNGSVYYSRNPNGPWREGNYYFRDVIEDVDGIVSHEVHFMIIRHDTGYDPFRYSATVTINPRPLTWDRGSSSNLARVDDKDFDGNTEATVQDNYGPTLLDDYPYGDIYDVVLNEGVYVTFGANAINFAGSAVGIHSIEATASSWSLSGDEASNFLAPTDSPQFADAEIKRIPITSVTVNVTEPSIDAIPEDVATLSAAVPSGSVVSINPIFVTWFSEDPAWNPTDPFVADVEYTATFTLEASPNFTFEGFNRVNIMTPGGGELDFAIENYISGVNSENMEITFIFEGIPVYEISVSPSQVMFDATPFGELPPTQAITISNDGNRPTGVLTATLAGTDADAFTLSGGMGQSTQSRIIGSIGVGNSSSNLTITPVSGLSVGTYTATIEIVGGNDLEENIEVIFEVVQAAPPFYGIHWLPGSAITFGQTLSESILTNEFAEYGVLAWDDPTRMPNAGRQRHFATFTPFDEHNIDWTEVVLSFNPEVTVHRAVPYGEPTITEITREGQTLADTVLTLPYGGFIHPFNPVLGTVDGILEWESPLNTPVVQGEAYSWIFTPSSGYIDNYDLREGSIIPWPIQEPTITFFQPDSSTIARFANVVAAGETTTASFDIHGYNLRINREQIELNTFSVPLSGGGVIALNHMVTVLPDQIDGKDIARLTVEVHVFENTDINPTYGFITAISAIGPATESTLEVIQEGAAQPPPPPYVPAPPAEQTPQPESTPSPPQTQPQSSARPEGSRATADDDVEGEDENDDTYIMNPGSELGNGANPGDDSDSGQSADPEDESTPDEIAEDETTQHSGFLTWLSGNLWWLSIILGLMIILASWWFIGARKRRKLAAVAEDVIDITDT